MDPLTRPLHQRYRPVVDPELIHLADHLAVRRRERRRRLGLRRTAI